MVGAGPAHDAAASKGGPRYDPHVTPAQVRAAVNCAWLHRESGTVLGVHAASRLLPRDRKLRIWMVERLEKQAPIESCPEMSMIQGTGEATGA